MRTAWKWMGAVGAGVGGFLVVIWGSGRVMSHLGSEQAALVFMLGFGTSLFVLACVVALVLELYYQRHARTERETPRGEEWGGSRRW